jgi:hypothetical protein
MGDMLTRLHELRIAVAAAFCVRRTGLRFERVSIFSQAIMISLMLHNVFGGTYTTGRGDFHNSVAKHDRRSGGDNDEPEECSGHLHGRCIGEQSGQSADGFRCFSATANGNGSDGWVGALILST